jgi:hypothetical protein
VLGTLSIGDRRVALSGVGATGVVGDIAQNHWAIIDDSETANWQNIDDTQPAGWATIDDGQTTSWQDIVTN